MTTTQECTINGKTLFTYKAEYRFKNETYDDEVGYYDYDLEVEPISTKDYPLGFVTEKLAKIHSQNLNSCDVQY